MTNEVIRGGEVFHKAVVDVYDFDQQGTRTISALDDSSRVESLIILYFRSQKIGKVHFKLPRNFTKYCLETLFVPLVTTKTALNSA